MAGNVLIISGLSGAGKSTMAEGLRTHLESRGRNVSVHDGDSLRSFFDGIFAYTPDDRLMVSKLLVLVASALIERNIDVILATMLSQPGAREFLNLRIPDAIEIHLETSLAEVVKNDAKGLYASNKKNAESAIVGLNQTFAVPTAPDFTIRTHQEPPEHSLKRMIVYLQERGIFGLGGE